jgi:murein DD-endopeptidase MepM/ murein hydrolase activator NlpD
MQAFPVRPLGGVNPQFRSLFSAGHQGTDIFAPMDAEVLAVADGMIRHAVETKGGKAVYLTTRDGTQFYYGHLGSFAGVRLGPGETRAVKAGELIGYVGTSGNAEGKAPHVHFEMRPRGGAKVDPAPALQQALRLGWGAPISAPSQPFFPVSSPSSAPKSAPKPFSAAPGDSSGLVAVLVAYLLLGGV